MIALYIRFVVFRVKSALVLIKNKFIKRSLFVSVEAVAYLQTHFDEHVNLIRILIQELGKTLHFPV